MRPGERRDWTSRPADPGRPINLELPPPLHYDDDQSAWPAHLRDDAPTAVCGRCHRETVAVGNFGQEDRMIQPDGCPCGGRFNDPRGEGRG